MEENYKVDLGNGTVLEDLILNGTDFMSEEEITEDIFDDMGTVTITDGDGNETEYEHPELVYCKPMGNHYYFCIRNMTAVEVKEATNDAQIFYTAVMTDTLMED